MLSARCMYPCANMPPDTASCVGLCRTVSDCVSLFRLWFPPSSFQERRARCRPGRAQCRPGRARCYAGAGHPSGVTAADSGRSCAATFRGTALNQHLHTRASTDDKDPVGELVTEPAAATSGVSDYATARNSTQFMCCCKPA